MAVLVAVVVIVAVIVAVVVVVVPPSADPPRSRCRSTDAPTATTSSPETSVSHG